jgi:hypothetical protein
MYTAQTRTVALLSHVRFVLVYSRYEKLNNSETPTIIQEHSVCLFFIYLTMQYIAQIIQHEIVKQLVYNELEGMEKVMVVVYELFG